MPAIKIPDDLQKTVDAALDEDLNGGEQRRDVTADLVPEDRMATATIISREPAVICGRPWFDAVFHSLCPTIEIDWKIEEGAYVAREQEFCVLRGPARSLLTGERTALNFLQTLSGVASVTRRYVERVKGTDTQVMDTRKTIPGLRTALKYAVVCGGGSNHRMGLYDAALIKENHIAAAGSLDQAVNNLRSLHPDVQLMCEAETIQEVEAALNCRVDVLLLDNFGTHLLAKAVNLAKQQRRFNRGNTLLEASGNIDLNNIRDVADSGVDRVSIGSLTKHIQAIDLSMRFTEQ